MKLELHDKPYRRKDGHVGARATVECGGAHPKRYRFDTHGMTSTQVVERAAALDAYHAAKMAKLAEFASVRGVEFVVHGDVFRVVDCTIFDAQVSLYVDVRKVEQDGALTTVRGFPIRTKYRDIANVPSAADVREMVREALPDDRDVKEAHNEFVKKVHDKVKEKP